MTRITIITVIHATAEKVFDLSRNIDVHIASTSQTSEKAIAGRRSGLINLNETVTWQARHFGFVLQHKSRITQMESPHSFIDEMEEGLFRSFRHQHLFNEKDGVTIMTDNLEYETPFAIFGRLYDFLVLKHYMSEFLKKRNAKIRQLAES